MALCRAVIMHGSCVGFGLGKGMLPKDQGKLVHVHQYELAGSTCIECGNCARRVSTRFIRMLGGKLQDMW